MRQKSYFGQDKIIQFTNKYYPKFDQLSRILQILTNPETHRNLNTQKISEILGLPERQLGMYLGMMVGFGLIHARQLLPTPFGNLVYQFDPYFERLETLWIVHYLVSSQPKYVVWHRLIQQVLPSLGTEPFTANQVRDNYFSDLALLCSAYTYSAKLPGEIRAVCFAYTKSELARLELLKEHSEKMFVKSEPLDVPILALLYCLLIFRQRSFPGSSAINIQEIAYAENSPGRVLYCSEPQLRSKLEELHSYGYLRVEQMANLDQVRFSDALTPEGVLQEIYRNPNAHEHF